MSASAAARSRSITARSCHRRRSFDGTALDVLFPEPLASVLGDDELPPSRTSEQTTTKGGREMGAIRVHEFMSLDGVIDAPTWTFDYGFDPRMGEAIAASMAGCQGILLGRTTYEMFEPAWSQRTVEDDPGAPFFNDTTKYVVSGTLTATTWRNTHLLGPYDAEAIRSLKSDLEGDLYVSGSGTLVHALLADGLVDELHLFVYPLTLGVGPRLFAENDTPRKLSLEASASYDNGVVYLAYRAQG
ncbi:MAG TPA: dihydrofolate reductase family protein [Gaiellaceae bacterium]